MSSSAPVTAPSKVRVGFSVAQILLIAGLSYLWLTGESDATATSVDWAFVVLAALTPVALGGSWWTADRLGHRELPSGSSALGHIARITQVTTIALLVPTVLIAPLAVFGAIFFGPMG